MWSILMTKKERVSQAIGHKKPDVVPWNIELTSGEQVRVSEYLGIAAAEFFEFAGNHIEKVGYNVGGEKMRPGFYRDEYGVVWDRSGLDKDIGVVAEDLLKEARLDGYVFPEPPIEQVRRRTKALLSNGRDTYKFGKIGMTLFERAWSLRGMENLMMDMHLEPAFVEELLARIVDYNMAIIDAAVQYEIDGFYFGDDYGQQSGLLMSPDMWRKLIKPALAKMFERVKGAGKAVALHSCGNIKAILGDLIDTGLDIYQTVQPGIYDLGRLKSEYGRDLTFWGAISTQQALPFVSPAELRDSVVSTIEILGAGGGYICGPTHRVPEDVPPENVAALIETLKSQ
jgi:uroporphyrinogen decarboxylase